MFQSAGTATDGRPIFHHSQGFSFFFTFFFLLQEFLGNKNILGGTQKSLKFSQYIHKLFSSFEGQLHLIISWSKTPEIGQDLQRAGTCLVVPADSARLFMEIV